MKNSSTITICPICEKESIMLDNKWKLYCFICGWKEKLWRY
jgi:ribosomal protein S27AE